MRIGIELNDVVRDINKQVVKYYAKDIDKEFDDENVDYNSLRVIDTLNFADEKSKFEFMYVDYPYEVFGCAKPMHRNLPVTINNWIYKLNQEKNDVYDIKLFSLKEEGLSIQSTYYFLSKIGCRVREMIFPKDGADIWKDCDVVITTNKRIVKNKPEGNVVVLIKKTNNEDLIDDSDLVYDSLMDLIGDEDFFTKVRRVSKKKKSKSWFTKIINKLKKMN